MRRDRSVASRLAGLSFIALCFLAPRPAPAAPATPASYLVIPFFERGVEDPDERPLPWLGEALADGLVSALEAAGAEVATRDERRGIERELGIEPLARTTVATRLKEAEELEVERVILGDYEISGDAAQVTLRVYDPAAGSRGPVLRLDPVPLAQLARLQTDVSRRLLQSEQLAPALPPSLPPAGETSTSSYGSRVRALIEEDPLRKLPLLERALADDPEYLRGRIELALAQRDAGVPERALATLNARPLLADPGRTAPAVRTELAATAEALLGTLSLDAGLVGAAVDAFRRSLRVRDDAGVRIQLARALAARNDLTVAAAELELARRLDPRNPEIGEVQELLDAHPAGAAPAATPH